ncbi:MAG: ATP-binding protein [Bacteroidetes bacterium]|nr:ATP-binding protein [Bacteroidota bacterium]
MIVRAKYSEAQRLLKHFPAVAIVGPRQCGKSTMAKLIAKNYKDSIYLDLENPDDRAKLTEPTLFLSQMKGRLVCLDEVQFMPDIFNVLRSLIDKHKRNGQFLLLGSASPHLLRQSSETLAGRVAYMELAPFTLKEVNVSNTNQERKLWLRGGFPKSYLPRVEQISMLWRKNFIQTFLERDLSVFGFNVPSESMRRLWLMCAHLHGQPLNLSALGNSLGVSHTTAGHYIEVLSGTYMLQKIEPHFANLEKRLRKAPKLYVADSGILHALLNIEKYEDLITHPVAGFSWEGYVLQQIKGSLPDWQVSYIATSNQAEIDFILTKGKRTIAVECKLSQAPSVGRGFYSITQELKIKEAFVVCPVKDSFPLNKHIIATNILGLLDSLSKK